MLAEQQLLSFQGAGMWRFSVDFNNRPDSICSLHGTISVMAAVQNPYDFLMVNPLNTELNPICQ